ncbi:MAG: hypothetical protein WA005_13640 [Candidatus Binataceae bacterium]
MRVERISSRRNNRLAREPNLPGDFARRVIAKARLEQRQRRIRRRVAAAVCAVLVTATISLAAFMHSGRNPLASHESRPMAQAGWQEQSLEEARAYQLAQETEPNQIGDYLLPGAGALTEFAYAYTDASWQYDPNWSYSR